MRCGACVRFFFFFFFARFLVKYLFVLQWGAQSADSS